MKTYKGLVFSDEIKHVTREDDRSVYISRELGKSSLLHYLSSDLSFPSYFGANWDAFYDCLSSMYWISEPRVVLIHENLPDLQHKDLTTYLNILIDVSALGKANSNEQDTHTYPILIATFPLLCRDKVEIALSRD